MRVDYDGSIATNAATIAEARQDFAVLSGNRESAALMESFLKEKHTPGGAFEASIESALDAWSVGHMALQKDGPKELPDAKAIAQHRQEQLSGKGIEAAVLERNNGSAIRYRNLSDKDVRSSLNS